MAAGGRQTREREKYWQNQMSSVVALRPDRVPGPLLQHTANWVENRRLVPELACTALIWFCLGPRWSLFLGGVLGEGRGRFLTEAYQRG